VPGAGIKREQFVITVLERDAPTAEQLDPGDLERRARRAAVERGRALRERCPERPGLVEQGLPQAVRRE
jgi:hypothetical protein